MKKVLSVLLVLTFALLTFTACGGGKGDLKDSKYLGTWKCDKVTLKEAGEKLGDEWTITLKDDGTGTSVASGETSEFTWEPVDGGFKTKGDLKLTFKDDGDNIKAKLFGVGLVFIKQ